MNSSKHNAKLYSAIWTTRTRVLLYWRIVNRISIQMVSKTGHKLTPSDKKLSIDRYFGKANLVVCLRYRDNAFWEKKLQKLICASTWVVCNFVRNFETSPPTLSRACQYEFINDTSLGSLSFLCYSHLIDQTFITQWIAVKLNNTSDEQSKLPANKNATIIKESLESKG